MRDFCDDLIKRKNVQEYEGKEAFETNFTEQITNQCQLDPALIEHFRKLALYFLFDEDPDHEELEAEKD